jgi:D-amino-acid oxidase
MEPRAPYSFSVTVVGAGVIGLTSALRLAEAGHHVRVIADHVSPGTTSDIAAAVWYPFHVAPWDRVLGWAAVAFDVFKWLAAAEPDAGIRMVAGIELFGQTMPEPWLRALVPDARRATEAQVPPPFRDGYAFTVPVMAMNHFMPWLWRQADLLGVRFEQRHVRAIAPLLDEADAVVNCSGLGARQLVADVDLHPVRGQIVRVAQGHTSEFVQATSGPGPIAYIIPRPDGTVLGGTADADAWDLTADLAVEAAIRARCHAIVPALASAPVVARAVGLRPARSAIRLEAEVAQRGVVIHNYGHGGAGVTVSWGCAAEVVALLSAHNAHHETKPPQPEMR